MKRKVTLKQIAKELDVSISTVSKSLRDSSEISEDTRQKVQAFAKLYIFDNYKEPNCTRFYDFFINIDFSLIFDN